MSEAKRSWLEDIILAFFELGWDAQYEELYPVIEKIRAEHLTPEWKASVRRTIEDHSSDSENYKGKDIFKRLGLGHWSVRQQFRFDRPKGPETASLTSANSQMQTAFETILRTYSHIRATEPFGIHEGLWAQFETLKSDLMASSSLKMRPNIKVAWSAGKGVWAKVPWIAFLDDRVTDSTQYGVYVVLLFRQDMSGVYATFNQGVTRPKNKLGPSGGRQWLQENAKRHRPLCEPLRSKGFQVDDQIDLRIEAGLGRDYESSTIAHKFYPAGEVPSDNLILEDLEDLLAVYGRYMQDYPNYQSVLGGDGGLPETVMTTDRNIWLVAPGRDAEHWDDFYRDGIIAIGWDDLGDLSQFDTLESMTDALVETYASDSQPKNDALACYQFAHHMKPGDLILAKKGRSRIVGFGTIEGDYFFDDRRPAYKNTRAVRWEGRGEWIYDGKFVTKTVTEIGKYPDFVRNLEELVGLIDEEEPEATPAWERRPYSVDDALENLFFERADFEELLTLWRFKKNLILQGAPGTGKTFVARRLAYALMGYRDPSRLMFIQFHQSYAYEDFIQGYRPSGEGFALKNGPFYDFCRRATRDQDNDYVFIIDEINRGNLSKIFGELLMLVEADKRGNDWSIPLTYALSSEHQFYVPENLYLLGLMNTADRSLAVVDHALRRRFAFSTLTPKYHSEKFRHFLAALDVPEELTNKIVTRMEDLNSVIAEDTLSLGPGFQIGHSFFTPTHGGGPFNDAWYHRVISNEILPLLDEYWFEDADTVKKWRERLLASGSDV